MEVNQSCSKRGTLEFQKPSSDPTTPDGGLWPRSFYLSVFFFFFSFCTATFAFIALYRLVVAAWTKRYLQVRRPYVILADGERDPVIRDIIHLGQIKIQYSQVEIHRRAVTWGV